MELGFRYDDKLRVYRKKTHLRIGEYLNSKFEVAGYISPQGNFSTPIEI